MYTGGIVTILSSPFWNPWMKGDIILLIGVLLLLPGAIDGTTQMFLNRESTNRLRAVSGFLMGVGIPLFLSRIVQLLKI